MQKSVRFIHTADLHLGSTLHYTGEPVGRVKNILDTAVKKVFKRICDAALEYKVDFMIISGDLFDEKQQSIAANEYFYNQCKRLNEEAINIYIISGNHDASWKIDRLFDPPENVCLMGAEEVEIKEFRDDKGDKIAHIMGQSYRGNSDPRKMYSSYTPPDEATWNIGLLHSQLDPNNTSYVPCSYQDLCSKDDLHYWGLGHIHQSRILQKGFPSIVYSGIPQGRDFGEQGLGGCVLVDLIPDKRPQLKFIPTSSVIWKEVEITLEDNKNPRNLEELNGIIKNKAQCMADHVPEINKKFDSIDQSRDEDFAGYIVRWIIKGRGEIHNILQEQSEEAIEYMKKNLREHLQNSRPFIWTEDIELMTAQPLPSLEELQASDSIFEEIEQVIQRCRDNPELQKELLNEFGYIWEGEVDHENYSEDKFQLDEATLDKIIELARERIIEKLLEERGIISAD